jgi:hypothetical protein
LPESEGTTYYDENNNPYEVMETYGFGTPQRGVPGQYVLCWGKNPTFSAHNSWYQSHYLTVGFFSMEILSQCTLGEPCTLNLHHLGDNEIQSLMVIDDDNYYCGQIDEASVNATTLGIDVQARLEYGSEQKLLSESQGWDALSWRQDPTQLREFAETQYLAPRTTYSSNTVYHPKEFRTNDEFFDNNMNFTYTTKFGYDLGVWLKNPNKHYKLCRVLRREEYSNCQNVAFEPSDVVNGNLGIKADHTTDDQDKFWGPSCIHTNTSVLPPHLLNLLGNTSDNPNSLLNHAHFGDYQIPVKTGSTFPTGHLPTEAADASWNKSLVSRTETQRSAIRGYFLPEDEVFVGQGSGVEGGGLQISNSSGNTRTTDNGNYVSRVNGAYSTAATYGMIDNSQPGNNAEGPYFVPGNKVPVNSMVMNGPYFLKKVCQLGSDCTLNLKGVGLRRDDFVYLSANAGECPLSVNATKYVKANYTSMMNSMSAQELYSQITDSVKAASAGEAEW